MDEISLNHVDDQHGWLWTDTFKTNKKDSKGRAWIVDDFYENASLGGVPVPGTASHLMLPTIVSW